jgi:hypothetical protein
MTDPTPMDLSGLKRISLGERKSLVSQDGFGKAYKKGQSFRAWFDFLPDILASREIKEVVAEIARARKEERPVVLGMGAHPIKVGIGPTIIQLMEEGIITAIAMNGACIIHDTEIAMTGRTSEDVKEALKTGEFGMAKEASSFLNKAIINGYEKGIGLGEAVCNAHLEENFPFKQFSILSNAPVHNVPVTVHVAIGTDILHMDPMASGEAIGFTSHMDFKRFCTIVSGMYGGVYINLGSAVILPEVFLKAVTVARNLGYNLNRITTVTMDFLKHYRAETNVKTRPTAFGGKGYYLIGHHEIMFPLLAAAVLKPFSPARPLHNPGFLPIVLDEAN